MDSSDYVRFVHNLYEFNDTHLAAASERRKRSGESDVGSRRPYIRTRLVDLYGWCLMRNHYHLLLSEKVEGGLTLFFRKINTGYANYFNARYERTGTLFQGRTKKVLIEHQAQFLYILHYIHLNPLDYLEGAGDWRFRSKASIRDAEGALVHLATYRWSSFLDYHGRRNFPSLISPALFNKVPGSYAQALREYLLDAECELDPKLYLE